MMQGYARFYTCRLCLTGSVTNCMWSNIFACKCINLKLPNEL